MQCRSTDANLTEREPSWWPWERWWGGTHYGQTAWGDTDRNEGPKGTEVGLRCTDGKLHAKSRPRHLRFTPRFAVADVSFGDVESDVAHEQEATKGGERVGTSVIPQGGTGCDAVWEQGSGSVWQRRRRLVDGETCLCKKSVLDLRVFDFGVLAESGWSAPSDPCSVLLTNNRPRSPYSFGALEAVDIFASAPHLPLLGFLDALLNLHISNFEICIYQFYWLGV
ncbi:hypothetical protein B0H13DRAFT_1863112 [Mycena leptocephala]|nr:hypothetical protein B0H13DRAFT_1863112 [Mycena leptocephala]